MLVGNNIVLVLGVDGLQVRRHVHFVVGQAVFAEVVEEIGVARTVKVDVGVGGVLVLWFVSRLPRGDRISGVELTMIADLRGVRCLVRCVQAPGPWCCCLASQCDGVGRVMESSNGCHVRVAFAINDHRPRAFLPQVTVTLPESD